MSCMSILGFSQVSNNFPFLQIRFRRSDYFLHISWLLLNSVSVFASTTVSEDVSCFCKSFKKLEKVTDSVLQLCVALLLFDSILNHNPQLSLLAQILLFVRFKLTVLSSLLLTYSNSAGPVVFTTVINIIFILRLNALYGGNRRGSICTVYPVVKGWLVKK
jgi:hypothetical protein